MKKIYESKKSVSWFQFGKLLRVESVFVVESFYYTSLDWPVAVGRMTELAGSR
jgi:hypothetical protein